MLRLKITWGKLCVSVVLNESPCFSADFTYECCLFIIWKFDFGECIRLAFSIFYKQIHISTVSQLANTQNLLMWPNCKLGSESNQYTAIFAHVFLLLHLVPLKHFRRGPLSNQMISYGPPIILTRQLLFKTTIQLLRSPEPLQTTYLSVTCKTVRWMPCIPLNVGGFIYFNHFVKALYAFTCIGKFAL